MGVDIIMIVMNLSTSIIPCAFLLTAQKLENNDLFRFELSCSHLPQCTKTYQSDAEQRRRRPLSAYRCPPGLVRQQAQASIGRFD